MEQVERLSMDLSAMHLGSKAFLPWRCSKGHEWRELLRNRARGTGCPYCSGKRVAWEESLEHLNPHLARQWSPSNAKGPGDVLPTHRRAVEWLCPEGHEWSASPWNRQRGQECPYCGNKATLPGYNDLATTHPHLWREAVERQEPCRANESQRRVLWRCGECSHEWKSSPRNRALRGDSCPACSKVRISKPEREVRDFLEELGYTPLYNDRIVLRGRELDIYLPELKLAIEVNGDYWHSRGRVQATHGVSPEQYHGSKRDDASRGGVALAFLWQGDWIERRGEMKVALQDFLSTGVAPPSLSELVAPGERGEESHGTAHR